MRAPIQTMISGKKPSCVVGYARLCRFNSEWATGAELRIVITAGPDFCLADDTLTDPRYSFVQDGKVKILLLPIKQKWNAVMTGTLLPPDAAFPFQPEEQVHECEMRARTEKGLSGNNTFFPL